MLVTGATGYVGGRLLRALEQRGHQVRCLARRPEYLEAKVAATTEVLAGDVLDPVSLDAACKGVSAAYYLVHSMGSQGSFEDDDRTAAVNFAAAAEKAGIERIIYLGGLGHDAQELSAHLRSRQEVGGLLRKGTVPVLEFRASIVIGSGSLSFEMIRSLVERLPVMLTPKWVSSLAQPIAIADLIEYLLGALALPTDEYGIYEIGGADQVSYGDIMRAYAACRHLKLRMIPVPVLTPHLSSLWLGLVTPIYARVGKKLIESIVHSTVVRDDRALKTFAFQPMGMQTAISQALANEEQAFAATRWSDARSSSGKVRHWKGTEFGTRLVDSRSIEIAKPPEVVFAPITRIGGEVGWYAWDSLWRIRGWLDLLVGGAGLRRGRSDANRIAVGDTLDFWRVEAYEPNRRLRLSAEMRLPGRAWLEFEVNGDNASSTLRQTAIFDPVGLSGRAYWYLLYPLHQLVFAGMLRGITKACTASK